MQGVLKSSALIFLFVFSLCNGFILSPSTESSAQFGIVNFSDDSQITSPVLEIQTNGNANSISLSENGLLVVGSQGEWDSENAQTNGATVYLFEQGLENLLWSHTLDDGRNINDISISGSGNLITGTSGNEIFVWDVNSSTPKWSFSSEAVMYDTAISSNGESFVSSSGNGDVFFFSSESSNPIWASNIGSKPTGLDISEDGGNIIVNNENGLYLYDSMSNNAIWSHAGGSNSGNAKISGDGNIVVAEFSESIKIFEIESSTPIHEIMKMGGQPWAGGLSLSYDGEYFANCDWGSGNISYYNQSSLLWSYQTNDSCWDISISSDGSRILAGSGGNPARFGTVYLWDSDSNIPLWNYEFAEEEYVMSVELSNDGSRAYLGTQPQGVSYFYTPNEGDDAWLNLELISWQGNSSTTWDTDGTDMDVQFQVCIDLDGDSDGISPLCTWTEVWNNTLTLSNAWETTFDLIEDNTTLNITIECWDNDEFADEWGNGPDACDLNPDDDEWRLYYEANWSNITTETFSGDGSIGNDTQWGNAESTWKVTVSYYGDEDNDGVSDNLDYCNGTTRSFELDINGCSWYQLDADFDGIINDFDDCPNLANESYCGTNGNYIPVSYLDFKETSHHGLLGVPQWDISPNGELLAVVLGRTDENCPDTGSVSGLIVLSLEENYDNLNFCDSSGVVFNPYHSNAIYNSMQTEVMFSRTGNMLYYNEMFADDFVYDTSEWLDQDIPFQIPTGRDHFYANDKITAFVSGCGGCFVISDINGEQISVQTGNEGVMIITGTDDSNTILVASRDSQPSNLIYKYSSNSTLSLYNLSTGQKDNLELPNILQENGNSYFLGAKISSNGLRIIVSYGDGFQEKIVIYERDRDSDGVTDTEDMCPDVAGEFSGCLEEYFDTDKDGVNDKEDQCPGTIDGINVDSIGCALNQLDSDGDGISDATDQCPNTPAGDSVGLTGCSGSQIDSDGDGVYDSQDNCPSTPSGSTVDSTGCAADDVVDLDSDGDGIRDSVDVCPNSATGIIVDSTGCETGGDIEESNDEVSSEDLFETAVMLCVYIIMFGLLVALVTGVKKSGDRLFPHKISSNENYDWDYDGDTSVSNVTIPKSQSEPNLELQNIVAELERQHMQSEHEMNQLRLQQAQQSSASEIAAIQQEMQALQQRVADSEQAKLQLQNEIEQVKIQKDESLNMQDSVVGGDMVAPGGQKIESQTNVMGTDPEAIARIIFEAQEKERERLRKERNE